MPDILSQEEIDALLGAEEAPKVGLKGDTAAKLKESPKRMTEILTKEQINEMLLLPQKTREALLEVKEAAKILDQTKDADGNIPAWHTRQTVERLLAVKAAAAIIAEAQVQKPDTPSVYSYDFKHPARLNRSQMRTLENLHDNFARLLSSTLSGALRTVVDVDTAFVDQTTYAEFIMSLSNPSCSYQFTLGPTNGQAILDFALPVVFGSVDRTFGGKGSPEGVDARQLTPIEIQVINRIVKKAIEDLEATWEPVVQAEIRDIELEVNPEFMQITAANEIVLLLAFEVNSAKMSGLVSLCYPFFTLEPILPRLNQQSYAGQPRGDKEKTLLDNRLRLGAMDVPLVAELGRTRLPLSTAGALKAGDIIRLPNRANQPVPVFLGGKAKFLARPFAEDNGECRLMIAGKVPPAEQGGYGTV